MGGKRVQSRGETTESGTSFGNSICLAKSKFLAGGLALIFYHQR